MKRVLLLIIFFMSTLLTHAQWSKDIAHYNGCYHAKSIQNKSLFSPDHSWQSKFLFDYDVTSYILDIHVKDNSTYIKGNAIINATALVEMDTFAFELIPEQNIEYLLFNGGLTENYYREDNNVIVPIETISAGSSISARVYYEGQPPSGGFFSGVTTDSNEYWQTSVTWTLSEPFAACHWFPVKQDLNDKADSAILNFTTEADNMVGSQGLLQKVVTLPDNKKRYEWKTNYPIDYYLLSFAVADYYDYSIYAHPQGMGEDSLLIQNFIYNVPENIEVKKEPISKTIDILELFSDLFSLYPFIDEKYGHCQTQLGGGMEHQTMSTMGEFSFHLIAHELGHMWFGDNVTCATWNDIWINEGFATYTDYLANEYLLGDSAATVFITRAQNHAMEALTGSIYVPDEAIYPGNEWRIFSGALSYDKGASIIHMLRHEINNDQLFFDILKKFQLDFAGGTATGDDFRFVAEELSGIDLGQFFDQWYYGQGFPIYNYTYWNEPGGKFYLSSTQSTANPNTTLFKMKMDYRLVFNDGSDTIVSFYQTDNLNVFSLQLNKLVVDIEVDPNNWTLEMTSSISLTPEKELEPGYFTIGPNPAKESTKLFFLVSDSSFKNIRITNIRGQLIFETNTTENTINIAIGNFESGIYTVSVSNSGNIVTKKLIIQK